jgi:hypothetical protein
MASEGTQGVTALGKVNTQRSVGKVWGSTEFGAVVYGSACCCVMIWVPVRGSRSDQKICSTGERSLCRLGSGHKETKPVDAGD